MLCSPSTVSHENMSPQIKHDIGLGLGYIINNQSGISIHCYGVVDWKHVHVLFTFEQLLEGGTITNIKVVYFFVF